MQPAATFEVAWERSSIGVHVGFSLASSAYAMPQAPGFINQPALSRSSQVRRYEGRVRNGSPWSRQGCCAHRRGGCMRAWSGTWYGPGGSRFALSVQVERCTCGFAGAVGSDGAQDSQQPIAERRSRGRSDRAQSLARNGPRTGPFEWHEYPSPGSRSTAPTRAQRNRRWVEYEAGADALPIRDACARRANSSGSRRLLKHDGDRRSRTCWVAGAIGPLWPQELPPSAAGTHSTRAVLEGDRVPHRTGAGDG